MTKIISSLWYNKPQTIEYWDDDINYVMFVDENGDNYKLKYLENKIKNSDIISPDEKYFTITGCIFTRFQYKKANEYIGNLKCKYWNDGYYYDTKRLTKKIRMFTF